MLIGTTFVPHSSNVYRLMEENKNLYNTDMRMWILFQQAGCLSKYFKVYPAAYKDNETLVKGYRDGEARICMMNILIQIDLLCEALGWNVDRLRYEGYQHLVDKIAEVKAKGGEIV